MALKTFHVTQGRMHFARRFALPAVLAFLAAEPGPSQSALDPLKFFEGRTESEGTIKIMMRKPHRMRSVGHGRIEADGSLSLVQKVEEEGEPPHERRWRIRQTAPGRFSGTMSQASGPVTIEEIGGRYRFRFKMKGGMNVEQWLTPQPGGTSARNTLSVKKLGVTVASGDGMIRRLP